MRQIETHTDLSKDKLAFLEARLMRNNMKVHESTRQILILIQVFDDFRASPDWMAAKLHHELQDFLEAERPRLSLADTAAAACCLLLLLLLLWLLLLLLLFAEVEPLEHPLGDQERD